MSCSRACRLAASSTTRSRSKSNGCLAQFQNAELEADIVGIPIIERIATGDNGHAAVVRIDVDDLVGRRRPCLNAILPKVLVERRQWFHGHDCSSVPRHLWVTYSTYR